MANRILLGNRSTGGGGCYVGKNSSDVLTSTDGMQLDSRMGASLVVHSYGQGTIAQGTTFALFSTGLSYAPLYAMRWCTQDQISSGVAIKAYSPSESQSEFIDYEEEEESDSGSTSWGCTSTINGSNQIVLQHHYDGDGYGSAAYEESMTIYWAVVVFHQADFTSGEGL